jgi:hypothetical protein
MSNFSAIQVLLQWDDDADDGVRFVLDQHALLNFYRASSLKQQSEGRHVSLGNKGNNKITEHQWCNG